MNRAPTENEDEVMEDILEELQDDGKQVVMEEINAQVAKSLLE